MPSEWDTMMRGTGADLYTHVETLFPICRSITGDGLRATLRYIARLIPLAIREVPSGTKVLDWEVPPEWTIRDAAISTLDGGRVVDFHRNNLHLVQYSRPLDRIVSREELDQHLYSLPDQPDLIPYRTAYYAETWGFCLAHRERLALTEEAYRVTIDSTLTSGSLSYGECLMPGELADEVLFSAHCCHPSLANDNLSALAVAIELARALSQGRRRFSYRFLFMPGTIGAITWLHFNRDALGRIRHGLVLSCLGDGAPLSYKRSRRGDAAIDRYTAAVLRDAGQADRVMPFVPYGYDERQYLLARLRPAGRVPHAIAARDISGVPYLGRQPLVCAAGGAGGLASHASAPRCDHRAGRDLAQHLSLWRAAAWPSGPLCPDRRGRNRRHRLRPDGAALGAQPGGWRTFAVRHGGAFRQVIPLHRGGGGGARRSGAAGPGILITAAASAA